MSPVKPTTGGAEFLPDGGGVWLLSGKGSMVEEMRCDLVGRTFGPSRDELSQDDGPGSDAGRLSSGIECLR